MKTQRQRAAMEWIYATPAQESYIRRLRSKVAQYRTAKWSAITRRMLKSEASTEIEMLLAAIKQGKANDAALRTTRLCESDHCGRKNPATVSYKNSAGVSFRVCATCDDPDFLASLGFVRADIAARVGATVGELANAEAGR